MSIITRATTDRRRRHDVRVRVAQLPLASRTALDAIEHYLAVTGTSDDAGLLTVVDDLVTRFEAAQAAGFSITDVVGADPVAFADSLKREFGCGAWLVAEQRALAAAIRQAEREQGEQ